jgi:DNA-binding NarL/FixJ family response regulator
MIALSRVVASDVTRVRCPGCGLCLPVLSATSLLGLRRGRSLLGRGNRAAANGEAWCPPRIATTLLHCLTALSAGEVVQRDASNLTGRERQIVELIDRGLSNKEIAQRLCLQGKAAV